MTNLLTNSELAVLIERVDRFADGDKDALTGDDVSRLLAEVELLRHRRTQAMLVLDGRARSIAKPSDDE